MEKKQIEKEATALSKRLKPLAHSQIMKAYDNIVEHVAIRRKSGVCYCLDCGHTFESQGPSCVQRCPHCGRELRAIDSPSLKNKDDQFGYFCVLTTQKEYQVFRFFYLRAYQRLEQEARLECVEVEQQYMAPDGSSVTLAYPPSMNWYYARNPFNKGGKFKVRYYSGYMTDDFYRIGTEYEIVHRLTPFLKRAGWRITCVNQLEQAKKLVFDPHYETMLKAGMGNMFGYTSDEVSRWWPQIKICIRNHYVPEDARMYKDLLEELEELGKDMRNPTFICPNDLTAAHNKWHKILERKRRKDEEIQEMIKAQSYEEEYRRQKGKFFGILINSGDLSIHVLDSVVSFKEEGDYMGHCVFSRAYYKEKDSLILSCTLNGIRLATIELSLKTYKVLQVRARYNADPPRREEIVRLVESNKEMFIKAKKKVA